MLTIKLMEREINAKALLGTLKQRLPNLHADVDHPDMVAVDRDWTYTRDIERVTPHLDTRYRDMVTLGQENRLAPGGDIIAERLRIVNPEDYGRRRFRQVDGSDALWLQCGKF
ncbi:hypothetical protein [Azospirillum palustre]